MISPRGYQAIIAAMLVIAIVILAAYYSTAAEPRPPLRNCTATVSKRVAYGIEVTTLTRICRVRATHPHPETEGQ